MTPRSAILVAALATMGATQAPDDRPVVEHAEGARVPATVDGRPVGILVGPGMPSDLYLSRAFARTIDPDADDLGPRGGGGFLSIGRTGNARVGPIRIAGRRRDVDVVQGDAAYRRSAMWFAHDVYPGAEVFAGPFALPEPVVRFRLRPDAGDERETVVPLAGRGRWWIASTVVRVGDRDVTFAFAPQYRTTIASAAAGGAMVRAAGGRFEGAAAPVSITHGVERPARPVTLDRAVAVGPIGIRRLLVRTADYGSAGAIADPAAADPSEADDIVVTGQRRRSPPSYVVYVGADALARCATITYDKPARTIALRCRP